MITAAVGVTAYTIPAEMSSLTPIRPFYHPAAMPTTPPRPHHPLKGAQHSPAPLGHPAVPAADALITVTNQYARTPDEELAGVREAASVAMSM